MAQINEHDKNHSLMINYLQGNQWLEFITIQGVCKYGNSTMTQWWWTKLSHLLSGTWR